MKWFACCLTGIAVLLGASLASVAADEAAAKEEKAPDMYKVKFETSCGDFVIEVHREWAPVGADRFHELVSKGFYDECRFFRVIPDFMVQFGINGDPAVQIDWSEASIKDDRVTQSNKRGYITFATSGQDSRTTQVFINFKDNSRLDDLGFASFGKVIQGMDIVDKINSQYGEQPSQPHMKSNGNEYLKRVFPKLDYVKKATIMKNEPAKAKSDAK